jgi:hypothetical protein
MNITPFTTTNFYYFYLFTICFGFFFDLSMRGFYRFRFLFFSIGIFEKYYISWNSNFVFVIQLFFCYLII